ncbi:MAG TPA: transglutaminase-like domain-containing protein [Tepidisphaeraceae bacterium]|nr:transglutaminase-like domain-containing protein [Tepidisphaeraceae bacterium]
MRITLIVLIALAAAAAGQPLNQGDQFEIAGKKGLLSKLDALPVVENEFPRRFKWDSFENPKLKELREKYHLDEVIAPGKDEFEKQLLLLDWVNHRFKKFGKPSSPARGAKQILEAIEDGHTFFCAHYADVFVSAAASLGWVDRCMALRRPDNWGSGSTEHSSTEIWSNQWRKWVMLDPTFAMYVEKDGVPLNAWEIRQEWFYHEAKDLVFVLDKDRKRYHKSDMPVFRGKYAGFGDLVLDGGAINPYGFIGYIPNTDLMDRGPDYGGMFITKDKICDGTKWHTRIGPSDPEHEPYFPMGQAAMGIAAETEGLKVELKTFTPNFKDYLARMDGGEWREVGDSFLWKLRDGGNRVEVKTVNKFGIDGPISVAEAQLGANANPAAIEKVEIGKNREIRVNGRPFFPLMSWAQRSTRFELLRSLGFNSFCGGRASDYLPAAQKVGGFAMVGFDEKFVGHPALLAWTHGDEPDLGFDKGGKPRKSAAEVVAGYERIRGRDSTRPIFLNLTSGFMEMGRKKLVDERKEYYRTVAGGADILSFDYYPIYGWNRPDRLMWVAEGVSQLREFGGAKRAVFECIETSKGSQWVDYAKQIDVKPEHTRAEVWMAIIRGATGIMYFTHAWRPAFNEFEPTEEMRAELKRLNGQITKLTPPILADEFAGKVGISFEDGVKGEIMAKEHEGSVYLFANDLDMKKGGKAMISLEGLKKGQRVEVVDEGREIAAEQGNFSDEFGALGVHIYRIAR